MKKLLLLLLFVTTLQAQESAYERNWGTYFGDVRFSLQESNVDSQGNLYLSGFYKHVEDTAPPVFNTQNTYQSTYGGGESDGFIAKFNNSGQLLWATYVGGPGRDIISGMAFDGNDNMYILGSTESQSNIATANAYQAVLNGPSDFFITKFSAAGTLVWSSYYGGAYGDGTGTYDFETSERKRMHLSHDGRDHFYIAGHSFSEGLGTTGTFQPLLAESAQIIAKFDNSGQKIWATYYSSNGNHITGLSATTAALYVRGRISDCTPLSPYNTYYGTANAYQSIPLRCLNTFLSRFNTDGQREWSTYYALSNTAASNSVKAYQDKIYFSGSSSGGLVTTPGVFQENSEANVSPYLVQFTESGSRDWGTFNGTSIGIGSTNGSISNISISAEGGLYLSGSTQLNSNIATTGAYQSEISGMSDGFIGKFNNLGQKTWGTYYGGAGEERNMYTNPYGENFYIVGRTNSTSGMATAGSYQPDFAFNADVVEPTNIFIAHFIPRPLATNAFSEKAFAVFPNPNSGRFTVLFKKSVGKKNGIVMYDLVGKTVLTQDLFAAENTVYTNGLAKGIYLAKITTENQSDLVKLVIE